MASKRAVLEQLSRDELVAAVDHFALTADDRRSKEALVDAVASSKKARLAEIVGGCRRSRRRAAHR